MVRRTPPNRTEDLNVTVCEEATFGVIASAVLGKALATHRCDPKTKKPAPGSKQSRVIAMLQSPTGATIAAMMKATGWQQHSVRGFLAGVVRKRLKLKLGSKKVDGNRVYQIASGDSGKSASPSPNAGQPERMPRVKIGPALPDRATLTSRSPACVISTSLSFAAIAGRLGGQRLLALA